MPRLGKLRHTSDGQGNAAQTDNPFRFQGQYHDEETGLHYNRHRYYDPEIGRFTTQDPIVLLGDQSSPKAGSNKSGKRHTSGPLLEEHGGTGNFGEDLEVLTGGTRPRQQGDSAPPGSLVGENGIFGRPKNSEGGSSIDIPANGGKPHETLHYPGE
ncbi:RHS repeat-associated core domain-containing protein [Halomonas denitrificans]|uniref:RHS repeat-associated core domain-containing protein n=1 Tax=Halomonas denitrificans TaxID=370769 RepID=UPI001C991E1F|nr:RHS repeat-associated core domain-containing protein [Halomonas denitrificans]MBY5969685.1 RHS repeat-associated core domain-containing protein [Halomonas denitrificans]